MRLSRLQLFDYRNFHRIDLELTQEVAVFIGDNAHGKSNLLEAIYLLATMRAVRAETDVQLVRRELLGDPQPAARVVGNCETRDGELKLEVAIVAREGARGPLASKTVRVNGAPKRLADAVGRFTAVLFTVDDMDMVTGSPARRRGFVDTMLSQVDSAYSTALRKYDKVLTQRNSLLKRIREGQAGSDELEFWDSELAGHGGVLIHRRSAALSSLATSADESHAALAPGEVLGVKYQPRVQFKSPPADDAEASEALMRALKSGLDREIGAGMTLSGPHRDDVELQLDGASASGFASRAQQRTIALALRLAEVQFLLDRRGEPPVLLLDDILSEMDPARRRSVLGALGDVDQMLITGTDLDRFPAEFSSSAQLMRVESGSVAAIGVGSMAVREAEA